MGSMSQSSRRNRKGTGGRGLLVASSCLLAFSLCALPGLTGCKDSNTIKNIVHDQNSDKVVKEAGKTQRVVTKNGKFTSKDTGLYETTSKKTKKLPLNIVYASKDAETQLPVAKFEYSKKSSNSSEASEGVSPESQEQDKEQNKGENDPDQSKQKSPKSNSGKSTSGTSKGRSKGKSKGSQQGTGKSKGKGSGKGTSPNGNSSNANSKGKGDGDAKATVYDTTGENPDIPDVGSIAAYGQLAVAVQMVGGQDGKTPLVAADDELLGGKFKQVFSDEGSGSVNAKAWKSDGDGAYTPNVEQIVKAKPDTVLVTSDGVFSKKEKSKLAKAKISITVCPQMNSDTSILVAVETIAKMLDKSTNGLSTERYNTYRNFHDQLISDVEGNRGYGARNKVVYDPNAGSSKPKTFNASRYTLLIDKWDYDATYSYRSTITTASQGIGLCTVGYRTSPVSYYLGCAGVVNNGAALDTSKQSAGLLAPAWQFNTGELNPSDASYGKAYSSAIYSEWDNGFAKTTLTVVGSSKNAIASNGFGTTKFPVVIVGNQKMKRSFKASAANSKGLYHAFGYVKAGSAGTIHGTLAGGTPVITAIDEDVDLDEAIQVNPHGLFSDWTQGSVESCLESAWAANIDAFDNDWSGKAEDEVKDFYETNYRYRLSDSEAEDILDGAEK